MIGRIIIGAIGIVLLLPGICSVAALMLVGPQEIILMFALPGILVGIVGVVVFGAAFERFSSKPRRAVGRNRK